MDHNVKALVLAAGKGTRLQTEGIDLPKVMRQADGHPLLYYVLRGLSFLPPEDIILVVGWKKEKVLSAFPQYPHAVQETLNGTGGAVQYAAPLLKGFDGHLVVCCGDAPMMRQQTFQSLVDAHLKEGNACTQTQAREYLHVPEIAAGFAAFLKDASKFLMVAALAAIGLNTDFKALCRSGAKPMLHGFIVSLLVVLVAIAVEYAIGVAPHGTL